MKRILLLGLIGFATAGYCADKVTNEYLVGNWECKGIRYQSLKSDGGSQFPKYVNDGDVYYKWSFKSENSQLYKLDDKSKEWHLIHFIEKRTGEEQIDKMEDVTVKFKGTIEKVSANEFKLDDEFIENKNDTRLSYMDFKVRTKCTCNRIK